MEFTTNFLMAFNNAMKYEIGPWFNSSDPDTVAGLISTPLQRRKVGYVNDPSDNGGETKYGVAKNGNPSLNISTINLALAMNVYYNNYWLSSKCDSINNIGISIFYFDMVVNHGISRGGKILQQSVNAVIDGNVGPKTIGAVNALDAKIVINSMSSIRATRYHTIVQNTPSQVKFLNGWLRRNSEVTQFSLSNA